MTEENKRTFLQETTFEEDVNLDNPPKVAVRPNTSDEMRQRWAENSKK